MRTISRLLPLVLLAPVLALPLVGSTPATADDPDPIPAWGQEWPTCGQPPDTDGRYCVISVTRNGVAPDTPPPGDGEWEAPYVDLIGDGDVRFGVYHWIRSGDDLELVGDVDPDAEWVYTVNTGSIRPREVYGHIRDVDLALGGNAGTGWTFELTLKPVPIAWNWGDTGGGEDGPLPCSYDGGCGDDSTVAGLVYDGFVTGYVTDDAGSGLTPAEIVARTGYVNAYNAQDAYWYYDMLANSIVVRMANVHLTYGPPAPEPATGFFETFIPNAMLVNTLQIPDPASLTAGSFTVRRGTGSTEVPFTLVQESGGIRIKIAHITFSRQQLRIKPNPSRPGVPRWGAVKRASAHAVKVRFQAPYADGGAAVTSYTARCRRGSQAWHRATGSGSPLTVRGVPRKPVRCQVRAVNRIGPSLWSPTRQG